LPFFVAQKGKKMSIKTIRSLEKDLNKVLKRYEAECEITTAEICGVLGVLRTDREIRALLPYCVDLLKDLLGIAAETEGAAPVGEILTLEGKERSEMEN